MAFRLTFVLCLLIFGAMYVAPDRPDPVTEQAEATAPEPQALAEVPPEPDPPAVEPPARDLSTGTDRAVAEALAGTGGAADAAGAPDGTNAAEGGETALSLGTLALDNDGASSLSLADSVRERTEAARQATGETVGPVARAQPETPLLPRSEPEAQPAVVTGSAVNLRAGPSTASNVVGRVTLGDRVEVVSEPTPGWSEIRVPGIAETAFIASQFLGAAN